MSMCWGVLCAMEARRRCWILQSAVTGASCMLSCYMGAGIWTLVFMIAQQTPLTQVINSGCFLFLFCLFLLLLSLVLLYFVFDAASLHSLPTNLEFLEVSEVFSHCFCLSVLGLWYVCSTMPSSRFLLDSALCVFLPFLFLHSLLPHCVWAALWICFLAITIDPLMYTLHTA